MRRVAKNIGWLRPPVAVFVLAITLLAMGLLTTRSQAAMSRPLAALKPVQAHVKGVSAPPVDCAKVPCFALTFDDGPDAALTPQVLDALARHNAHATFFVLGNHVAGNEQILKRIHNEGHEIGNHSWGHPWFTKLSAEQVESEIANTQTAIMRAGVPAPDLFRPPYGDMNEAVRAHVPLTIVRWNVDPEDWHPKKQRHILEHLQAHARPGGMVVLHDTEAHTVTILDQAITQLQASGYTLVTVSDLLSMPAGQPGVFFGRQNVVY